MLFGKAPGEDAGGFLFGKPPAKDARSRRCETADIFGGESVRPLATAATLRGLITKDEKAG